MIGAYLEQIEELNGIISIAGEVIYPEGPTPSWTGEYTFVSGDADQVVPVSGYKMTQDVTIQKIPSNYGKIIWDGSTLKVQ